MYNVTCVCALSNAMSYDVKSYMFFYSMVFDKLTGVGKNSPNCRFDTLPEVKFDKLKGSLIFCRALEKIVVKSRLAGRDENTELQAPKKGLVVS